MQAHAHSLGHAHEHAHNNIKYKMIRDRPSMLPYTYIVCPLASCWEAAAINSQP